MKVSIWWIRRDLRLTDNQALHSALECSDQVIPLFILDPKILGSSYSSEKRTAFLFAGLRSLHDSLTQRGSRLVIRKGNPLVELTRLKDESGAGDIFAEPDYSPLALRRDKQVNAELLIQWMGSPVVQPPGTVVKDNGQPYTIFTAFSRAWKARIGMSPDTRFFTPSNIHTQINIDSLPIPDLPGFAYSSSFQAGEDAALQRLEEYISSEGDPAIYSYAIERDRLDEEGTSRLSPYFRFGMLSARQAVAQALKAIEKGYGQEAHQGAEIWLNELIWREFYVHILFYFPQVRKMNFRVPHVSWRNNPHDFQSWCNGRTGYPVVDAGMRQLVLSGWMHNRARMLTASFLTKDLLVDWRWGEKFFMQNLIDGDPSANNGGWQWTAGTGTDAAPYFRIFNPITQSKKHDPNGMYIRRWVAELRNVPDEFIHEPWLMPAELQSKTGCIIDKDYPAPIVNHSQARERALRAYGQS